MAKKIAHVDALSRAIAFVEALPLEKEMQYGQLQDTKNKSIANDLKFQDHEKFELIDSLVFRKGIDKPYFLL